MPVISRFLGVSIVMYHRDHQPPHFHAKYGNEEATMEIESGLATGSLSRRVLQLVDEWRLLYQSELQENWQLARQNKPLKQIPPLD
jgi:uncharacterized protein DUF4160